VTIFSYHKIMYEDEHSPLINKPMEV